MTRAEKIAKFQQSLKPGEIAVTRIESSFIVAAPGKLLFEVFFSGPARRNNKRCLDAYREACIQCRCIGLEWKRKRLRSDAAERGEAI